MTENNKSEQNEGDGDLCDYWNDRTEDCVQNEMMSGHKTENWVQNELTDGHTSWNNRIWHRNWIQSKLTGGHNIWSRNSQGDRVRNKLTSHSIESVGQAVGVRSDRRCRQITFGIDTAACRTVVPARQPATRGYRCHWDAEAGVQYSTTGKTVVWDEGRRLLVSKDTEGKLMTSESRQPEARRPLMAVKPMTQQGQWVCFGLDRAFAYKIETGRVIHLRARPKDGTSQLNSKHQRRQQQVTGSHGLHDDGGTL